MKIRYIFLVSLILIILTIGASSASQNMTFSPDSIDEPISAAEDDLIEVLHDESDDGETDSNNSIGSTANDDNNMLRKVSQTYNNQKQNSLNDNEYRTSLGSDDLNINPIFKQHNTSLTYQKSNVQNPYSITEKAGSAYKFKVWIGDDDFGKTNYKFMDQVFFSLPDNAKGTLYLKINEKSFKVKVKSPLTVFSLKKAGLKVGTYTLKATYKDSNNNYPEKTVTKKITVTPTVEYSSEMSVGEKDPIIVTAHKGSKITAILYKTDENGRKTKIKSYSATTFLKIPVDKIAVKGYNSFYLKVTCAKQTSGEYITIDVHKNHAKIKASVTKRKDSAKIVIKSPKSDSYMYVYLDGKHVKSINLKKGNVKTVLSSLKAGKHKIKLLHDNGVRFYSNTFYIIVKKADKVSMSLKNVNAKKSAKKLLLKATVKYNKKPAANKKVTFKFNGKKYMVKTDKNGIAKLKINKNLLKKLQVGKKYRYTVTYAEKSASKKVLIEK